MRAINPANSLSALLLMFVMAVGSFALTPKAHAAEAVDAPKVIALKFHADWCGSCKVTEPIFDDLTNKFDTQPVLFTKLNLTTSSSRSQAGYTVSAMELDSIWNEHGKGKKTGFILLIDTNSKKVVAKLTREHDIKKMGAAIMEAVENAS